MTFPKRSRGLEKFLLILLAAVIAGLPACSSGGGQHAGALSPEPWPGSIKSKQPVPDLSPDEPFPVKVEWSQAIVREDDPDQKTLYAKVYRPDAAGRFPAILMASAYRRN